MSGFQFRQGARYTAQDHSQIVVQIVRRRSRDGAGPIGLCKTFHTAQYQRGPTRTCGRDRYPPQNQPFSATESVVTAS